MKNERNQTIVRLVHRAGPGSEPSRAGQAAGPVRTDALALDVAYPSRLRRRKRIGVVRLVEPGEADGKRDG